MRFSTISFLTSMLMKWFWSPPLPAPHPVCLSGRKKWEIFCFQLTPPPPPRGLLGFDFNCPPVMVNQIMVLVMVTDCKTWQNSTVGDKPHRRCPVCTYVSFITDCIVFERPPCDGLLDFAKVKMNFYRWDYKKATDADIKKLHKVT